MRVFDSWVHEQDVRRALDRPGGERERGLGHVARTGCRAPCRFVVGKQAGCAEGTAVRFDVSGPGDDARAFTIAVEGGRARPVGDDVDADGRRSRSRASTSCASAAAGPRRAQVEAGGRRRRWTGTRRSAGPCSAP